MSKSISSKPTNSATNLSSSKSSKLLSQFFLEDSSREELIHKAIDLAFLEDLGSCGIDLTTEAFKQAEKEVTATIYCKSSSSLIAGVPAIELVFKRLDVNATVQSYLNEGQQVKEVPIAIAQVRGKASAILSGERIALNLLQRMCAVCTTTSQFVKLAKEQNISILDTRKTTPCLRLFEKYAVTIGGGVNHRFGLNDAILIKDNHIEMAGGVSKAIKLLRLQYPDKPIEVECTTLEEVKESLNLQVDRILLDNMMPTLIRDAVNLIKGRCFVEVSGGITLANIKNYLIPGINAISVGALTHSATSVDLSLEVDKK